MRACCDVMMQVMRDFVAVLTSLLFFVLLIFFSPGWISFAVCVKMRIYVLCLGSVLDLLVTPWRLFIFLHKIAEVYYLEGFTIDIIYNYLIH